MVYTADVANYFVMLIVPSEAVALLTHRFVADHIIANERVATSPISLDPTQVNFLSVACFIMSVLNTLFQSLGDSVQPALI